LQTLKRPKQQKFQKGIDDLKLGIQAKKAVIFIAQLAKVQFGESFCSLPK